MSGSIGLNALNQVGRLIRTGICSRIVALTGAGISTPSGLPDFRSKGSGLYDNLEKYRLPYPEAVFDISYFRRNPEPFFQVAKKLYPGEYRPNDCHFFLRLLQDNGVLLRLYTQNIDGLERAAGIRKTSLVEAHGSFDLAACIGCGKEYHGQEIREDVFADRIPKCVKCGNTIKPAIVFFGENLPKQFFDLQQVDLPAADLMIVLGTSLEVYPFAGLVHLLPTSTPRLLINRFATGNFVNSIDDNINFVFEGDTIGGVNKLTDAIGWTEQLETIRRKFAVK